jgi:CheY-like chemotaxis protein
VVEDDKVVRNVLELQLQQQGYEVVMVATASEAIHAAQEQAPDLLILDLALDSDPLESIRDGFVLLGWLRRMLPDVHFPVIIHTQNRSPEVEARAQAEGVYAVFRKGSGARKFLDLVQQALADRLAQTGD